MLLQLVQYNDVGLYILRFAVAVIFLTHGLPKLFRAKMMASGMGMPWFMIFMLGVVESLGAIGLIAGYFIQLSALLLGFIMFGATMMKRLKWQIPFSAHDKTGWELDFITLCACIAILLSGGGVFVL